MEDGEEPKDLDIDNQDYDMDDKLLDSGLLTPVEPTNQKRKIGFKEKWEEVDELCPTCNTVSKPAEGLTRQNVKKLFSFQTDAQSLTILFLLLMCAAFATTTYTLMTSTCNCTNITDVISPQQIQMLDLAKLDLNLTCDVGEDISNVACPLIEDNLTVET